jgi:hypothetical protein
MIMVMNIIQKNKVLREVRVSILTKNIINHFSFEKNDLVLIKKEDTQH